jgi:hypothetical protein
MRLVFQPRVLPFNPYTHVVHLLLHPHHSLPQGVSGSVPHLQWERKNIRRRNKGG